MIRVCKKDSSVYCGKISSLFVFYFFHSSFQLNDF